MLERSLASRISSQNDICTPLFYRLNIEKDRIEFESLLNGDDKIVIYDEIYSQLQELIKLSNPTKQLEKKTLDQLISNHLNGHNLDEYGVWVYYRWSNRLVHILDEDEFIQVRTSRNQHKITLEEQQLLKKKKIGVIGLSVGQSVSVTLSIERICGELRIADFDLLELSNLNRIRTGLHNLGIKKTISVAREISEIDPFIKVICYHEGISDSNIETFLLDGGKLDILIDECDGLEVKVMCRQKAKSLKIPVVMEASDRGTLDIERFDLEPKRSILHGFIDHLDISAVKNLKSNEEKIPYLLAIAGGETISNRAKASMLEIGQTITTWPQLGSAVTYGGGITADVCRRILLNEFTDSGRYFVDLDELIKDKIKDKNDSSIDKINVRPSLTEEEIIKAINDSSIPFFKDEIGPSKEEIIQMVEAGIMAPSFANEQPWKWRYDKKKLFLFSEITYQSRLTDYKGSTSLIGLGAAAENLILKAYSLGFEVIETKFPLSNNNGLVSVFSFFSKDLVPNLNEKNICNQLVDFIPLRQTNRKITNRHVLENSVLEEFQKVANTSQEVELKFISEESTLIELAKIISSAERIRMLNKNGHEDFIHETKWTKEQATLDRKGIDIHSADFPPGQIAALNMAKSREAINYLTSWEKGYGLERFPYATAISSSAIGLLTTNKFDLNAFYEGGKVMERLWLYATQKNIAFQPITIATLLFNTFLYDTKEIFSEKTRKELSVLRNRFTKLYSVNKQMGEIILFRIFVSEKSEQKSLRIPVDSVLSFSEKD